MFLTNLTIMRNLTTNNRLLSSYISDNDYINFLFSTVPYAFDRGNIEYYKSELLGVPGLIKFFQESDCQSACQAHYDSYGNIEYDCAFDLPDGSKAWGYRSNTRCMYHTQMAECFDKDSDVNYGDMTLHIWSLISIMPWTWLTLQLQRGNELDTSNMATLYHQVLTMNPYKWSEFEYDTPSTETVNFLADRVCDTKCIPYLTATGYSIDDSCTTRSTGFTYVGTYDDFMCNVIKTYRECSERTTENYTWIIIVSVVAFIVVVVLITIATVCIMRKCKKNRETSSTDESAEKHEEV